MVTLILFSIGDNSIIIFLTWGLHILPTQKYIFYGPEATKHGAVEGYFLILLERAIFGRFFKIFHFLAY